MEITATIDYDLGDDTAEMDISNFDDLVKIEAPGLFEEPIYIDRQELIQALVALDVGS